MKSKLKNLFTLSTRKCCVPKAARHMAVEPKSKAKTAFFSHQKSHCSHSSPSSAGGSEDSSSTLFSLNTNSSAQSMISPHFHVIECNRDPSRGGGCAAACCEIHDSLAVIKDSNDPYLDFRQSLLEMIFQQEIYSGKELLQLLDCFLQLNSPCHHEIIVQAFMEICNSIIAWPEKAEAAARAQSCSSTMFT